MSELDKYKRRLIRSVARLLLEQKKPEDEVWELLSKEMKCDCKLLWKRMRAIAIKKINRLLPVDDRPESIAQIARLSFTDWLLFDLVLVHEDIDVIDRDRMQEVKGQWKSLMDLFTLVQRYNVEFLSGPPLREAWSSVAFIYNSTGRQCSPMMLQRRWYQLKQLTRTNFYNLWFNYRGNQKLWETAKQHTPSKLQMAIATRYPHIITRTFMEWEELIKERKVILPEEFGTRLTKENESKSNAPDLIVIEPEIETIDLELDSDPEETEQNQEETLVENSEIGHQEDPEENDDQNNDESNFDDSTIDIDLTTVKTEPEIDGLSNVQIMETTHLENVDKDVDKRLELQSNFLTAKRNLALQVSKFIEETEDLVEDNSANVNETIEDVSDDIEMNDDVTDTTDEMIEQKLNAYLNSTEKTNLTEQESIADFTDAILPLNLDEEVNTTADIVSDDTDELIKLKAKEFMSRTEKPVQNPEILIEEEIDEMDDIIKRKADDFVSKSDAKKAEVAAVEVSSDSFMDEGIEFDDDGIEFVDDGIEYVEDDDGESEVPKPMLDETVKEEISEESVPSEASAEDTPKFDLKLLMDPVIFTIKLDYMKVFKNKDFFPVRSKDILDKIISENIPIKKSENIPILGTEPEDVQEASMSEPENVQAASISEPENVIQTISENNTTMKSIVVKTEPENVQDASMTEPEIIHEATMNSVDDDITHTDDEYSDSSDDNIISDEQKVKINSHMLQKPRSRNYNPILLCKNPDFNTRLKRLTTGFFCSPRNCQLIKACKPMTIDLDKAFERKLVNGTMYLKTDGKPTQPIQNDNDSSQTTSVIPSAMPIQSLIDNTKMDINALIGLPSTPASTVDLTKRTDEEIAKRNKVINLRDITEIRRINQKLLTAEVTPIQVQNNDNTNVNFLEQPVQINKGKANEIRFAEQQNPPPPLSIDPPSLVPISSGKWSSIHGSTVINQSPAVAKKLPTYFSKPGPATKKIGRQNVKTDKPAPKPKTLPVYSQLTRGPLAWNNPKPLPSPTNDFLLTIDTLNKMIVKLSGYDECVTVSKKSRKKPWVVKQPSDQEQEKQQKEDDREKEDTNKITEVLNKPEKKSTKKKYCCWCLEKIEKIHTKGRTYQVHKCPLPMCNCCCRDQLIDALKEANAKNRTLMQGQQQNLCNSIESVVQQSNNVDQSSQTVPTPLVRVLPNADNDSAQITPSTSSACSGKTVVEAVLNTDLAQTLVVETGTNVGFNYEAEDNDATPIVSQEVVVNTDRSNELQSKEFDNNELRPVLRINITTDPPAPNVNVPVPKLNKSLNDSIPSQTQKMPLLQNLDISPVVRVRPKRDYSQPIYVPSKPIRAEVNTTIVLDGSKSCPPIPRTVVRENNKPKPIAPKHEKVIYLDTKNVAAKPSESPIYLGKNKILLTTVKFPPNFAREPENVQNPTVTPTLPLPQGVVLVLMPNGDLTYNIEPGVKLDDAQMAALPNIIAAVKQQLNANVLPLQPPNLTPLNNTDDVIVIGDDENATEKSVESTNITQEQSDELLAKSSDVTDKPEGNKSCDENPESNQASDKSLEGNQISNKKQGHQTSDKNLEGKKTSDKNLEGKKISVENPDTNQISDKNQEGVQTTNENLQGNLTRCELTTNTENIHNQDDKDISTENATKPDIEDPEIISQIADLNSSKESNEIIEINEDTETSSEDVIVNTNKEIEKSDETAGTRSLLSDLMEMSGISAEDTKPTQESTTQAVHTIPETTINVDLIAETNDATQMKPVNNAIASLGVPYPSSDVVNLPELTPVTSLAELKYACANDGSFFKLDLETGLIIPINVCIKKNSRNKNAIPSVKAVIDLTDDADATEPASAVKFTMVKAATANATKERNSKTMYTKIKPNILSVNKVYQKPERVKPVKLFKAVHQPALNTFTVTMRKSHEKNKRKTNSDVRIDMIDSDVPMEEEYLDNSFDSDDEAIALNKTKWVSILANRIEKPSETNKSEDSDDSDDEPLAKKVKRKETQKENVANDESCTTNSQETEKTQEGLPVAAVEAEPMDISNESALEDVGPANADDGEREPTPSLDFLDDESEGSQDDCILGV